MSINEIFYRVAGFAEFTIPFLNGLSYRLSYVRNYTEYIHNRFYHEGYFVAEGEGLERYSSEVVENYLTNANGYLNRALVQDYVLDNIINYKRQIKKHFFNATLVSTRDYQRGRWISVKAYDFMANGNTLLGIEGLHKGTYHEMVKDNREKSNIGYLGPLNLFI